MIQIRHKWQKNAVPVSDFPQEVYQIDKCVKCGYLLLHEYHGGMDYRKIFALGNVSSPERPECKPKEIKAI